MFADWEHGLGSFSPGFSMWLIVGLHSGLEIPRGQGRSLFLLPAEARPRDSWVS